MKCVKILCRVAATGLAVMAFVGFSSAAASGRRGKRLPAVMAKKA
jgi:hypothetical protein